MILHCFREHQKYPSRAFNRVLHDLGFWFENCNSIRTVLYSRQHTHKAEKSIHFSKHVLRASILKHYTLYLAQCLRKQEPLKFLLLQPISGASLTHLAFIPLIICLLEFLDRVPHELNQDIPGKLFWVIIFWIYR